MTYDLPQHYPRVRPKPMAHQPGFNSEGYLHFQNDLQSLRSKVESFLQKKLNFTLDEGGGNLYTFLVDGSGNYWVWAKYGKLVLQSSTPLPVLKVIDRVFENWLDLYKLNGSRPVSRERVFEIYEDPTSYLTNHFKNKGEFLMTFDKKAYLCKTCASEEDRSYGRWKPRDETNYIKTIEQLNKLSHLTSDPQEFIDSGIYIHKTTHPYGFFFDKNAGEDEAVVLITLRGSELPNLDDLVHHLDTKIIPRYSCNPVTRRKAIPNNTGKGYYKYYLPYRTHSDDSGCNVKFTVNNASSLMEIYNWLVRHVR